MVQRYLDSIPVTSRTDAQVLGNLSGWEVLEELREAGIDGKMVSEISDNLDLPTSTVYNVLRQLSAAGLVKVKRYKKKVGAPDKKRQHDELRTGKKKRIYVENINWGGPSFDDDFGEFISNKSSDIINKSGIAKDCAALIDKLLAGMKSDPDGKEMMPSKNICPNCETDHEATELVWAFLLAISQTVLGSEELEEKCKQHGLMI